MRVCAASVIARMAATRGDKMAAITGGEVEMQIGAVLCCRADRRHEHRQADIRRHVEQPQDKVCSGNAAPASQSMPLSAKTARIDAMRLHTGVALKRAIARSRRVPRARTIRE